MDDDDRATLVNQSELDDQREAPCSYVQHTFSASLCTSTPQSDAQCLHLGAFLALEHCPLSWRVMHVA